MFSTNNNSEVEEVDATMYGQCRCCLTNGQHRDVTKEYYYNNIKEVYKDIFLECFNLSLSPHNLISSLICENCVHRLRDATSFRMLVAASEEQLLNAVIFKSDPDNESEFTVVTGQQNFTTEIKVENEPDNIEIEPEDSLEGSKDNERMNDDELVNDDERMNDDDRVIDDDWMSDDEWISEGERMNDDERTKYEQMIEQRMNEDDDDDWSSGSSENELVIDESRENGYTDSDDVDADDDVDGVGDDDCESTFSSITMSTTSAVDDEPCEIIEGEQKLLSRFTSAPLPLPKRSELTAICPIFEEHLKKLEDKIVKPKSIEWYFKIPVLKEIFMSDKQALAVNATTIFEYSNATAFKSKVRKGYTCFYCREVCKIDNLREHQKKHSKASIYKLLTKFNVDEFVVYADITDLKCTLCKKKIKNLNDLKTHLTEKHGRKIFACADRVIPFKLKDKDFECQTCGNKFDTFGAIEKHMNTHFGSFICEACGAGFITKHRLAVHNYTQHKDEQVVCEVCKKSFRTLLKYHLHYDGVHKNVKKVKCTKCPEKFIDHFTRQKHLVDVHFEAPLLYKCSLCDKGFNRRFSLSAHVKRCHLDEKNIKCLECPFACYTKSELKDHMIKHQTPQKFECPICKRTYGRNRSLAMHIKKHKNDKS